MSGAAWVWESDVVFDAVYPVYSITGRYEAVFGHFYVYGHHQPGVTNVWERFEAAKDKLPPAGRGSGIGTPAELVEHLKQYQDAGVDQVLDRAGQLHFRV